MAALVVPPGPRQAAGTPMVPSGRFRYGWVLRRTRPLAMPVPVRADG